MRSVPTPPAYLDPSTLPPPSYTLSSRLSGVHTVSSINAKMTFNISSLLKSFLDIYKEQIESVWSEAKMASWDINEIEIYQTLTITDYEIDGLPITETIRTHEIFYNRKREDYVVLLYDDDVQVYCQVGMFFRVLYKGNILDLCLAQKYSSIEKEHITGLEIVRPSL